MALADLECAFEMEPSDEELIRLKYDLLMPSDEKVRAPAVCPDKEPEDRERITLPEVESSVFSF